MSKVNLKVSSHAIIEAEGDTMADLFRSLSAMQEVFSEDKCGCCNSGKLRYVVRKDEEENEYFELHCLACHSRLPFGQKKKPKGELYPKRKWNQLSDSEKEKRISQQEQLNKFGYLPNGGWYNWKKVQGQEESKNE